MRRWSARRSSVRASARAARRRARHVPCAPHARRSARSMARARTPRRRPASAPRGERPGRRYRRGQHVGLPHPDRLASAAGAPRPAPARAEARAQPSAAWPSATADEPGEQTALVRRAPRAAVAGRKLRPGGVRPPRRSGGRIARSHPGPRLAPRRWSASSREAVRPALSVNAGDAASPVSVRGACAARADEALNPATSIHSSSRLASSRRSCAARAASCPCCRAWRAPGSARADRIVGELGDRRRHERVAAASRGDSEPRSASCTPFSRTPGSGSRSASATRSASSRPRPSSVHSACSRASAEGRSRTDAARAAESTLAAAIDEQALRRAPMPGVAMAEALDQPASLAPRSAPGAGHGRASRPRATRDRSARDRALRRAPVNPHADRWRSTPGARSAGGSSRRRRARRRARR